MNKDALVNLARIGKLKSEPPSRAEFEGLLRSGRRRLQDAENSALHLESRFDLAYNAAHALALAALRWHGYRSENRYLVFQCLVHTLTLPNEQWRVLDQAHRKRNLAEYEGDVDVDEALVEAIIRAACEIPARCNTRPTGGGLKMSEYLDVEKPWERRVLVGNRPGEEPSATRRSQEGTDV